MRRFAVTWRNVEGDTILGRLRPESGRLEHGNANGDHRRTREPGLRLPETERRAITISPGAQRKSGLDSVVHTEYGERTGTRFANDSAVVSHPGSSSPSGRPTVDDPPDH